MANTAFLFPGQGAQTVGMGKQLFEELPAAKARFQQAGEILGFDLAKVCFEGPAEELNTTAVSQPALFVTALAALDKLAHDSPDVVENCSASAGLSLGEYTALVFADAIDFEAGLKLVAERGRAMQDAADAVESGMVSVLGMEPEALAELCVANAQGQVLQIANYLCPGNIVVSGDQAACDRLAQAADDAGAMKTIPLTVAGAFHTPIMQPAVERLTAALADVTIRSPRIPVVSNVDAQPHDNPEEIRSLLVQQVVHPVQWIDSMNYLRNEQKTEQFYELGPGRVLRGLLRRMDRKIKCENIQA